MKMQLTFLLLIFHVPALVAQDFSWPVGLRHTGEGFSRRGQDESHYRTDVSFPEENINPNAKDQKRLIVEWGKVSIGYIDDDDVVNSNEEQYRRIWKDDDSLRPDRRLSIRGTLLIESVDRKSRQPIDWVQGIRVVVSRIPDTKQDWSSRQDFHEATWGDFVIWENGEFLATVSPSDLRRSVNKEENFQVALSLGEKEGKKIIWRNTVGVLPQSVTTLKIPGPPAISESMQFINGAPSYAQNDFNPAKLVRAVNHLIPMGKEKAIRELRAFLKIAREPYETVRIDDNIDTSDRTCVFLIVRLLFEPSDPQEEPPPGIGRVPLLPGPDQAEWKFWPLYPVYLQDDIPFFLRYMGNSSGPPDQPEWHLDWAEKHGKIRTKPLQPLDNPMIAAERLVSLPQTKRLYFNEFDSNYDFRALLFEQAWNAIEDAAPESPKPKPFPSHEIWHKPDWDARLKAASKLNIHWSESEQKYLVK